MLMLCSYPKVRRPRVKQYIDKNPFPQEPRSGDEVSTRGPTTHPPQGFVRPCFSRAGGSSTHLCPPVRSNLHHKVAGSA
ncbi:U5 small nuclear ribonucleoprotein component [Fusarium oxysporum f. sp. albedinis]|nr:U5 small nuclear ribonucleoprotein component [Fusarium oxysporum f. sp. albedinis]